LKGARVMRVAIIGAGVLGASTAFHLALAGAEVVLVGQLPRAVPFLQRAATWR
jgi:glycine/D-amino acid oxidase-like deaminating enzyme